MDPAVGIDHVGRGLGPVEVAFHGLRASGTDLTLLPDPDHLARRQAHDLIYINHITGQR